MKTKTLFFSSLVAAAAMSTVPAWADTTGSTDSIWINFVSGQGTGADGYTGTWNDTTGQSGTNVSLTYSDIDGTASGASLTYSSGGTWSYSGATDGVLKGYLDDGDTPITVSVSNISYLVYDVTIIASSADSNTGKLTAKTVNGQTYTSDGDGNGILGSDSWGASRQASINNKNSFTVSGLTGDLSLCSTGYWNTPRGSIAGLIITNTSPDAIAATLSGTASDWTTSSLAGATWTNSTETTPTYANLTMSKATTLTLGSGVITDAIWAHGSGALTLAGEAMELRGFGILRADTGTSIAVNNTLKFTDGGTLSGTITTGDNGSIVVKSGTMNATALTGSGLNLLVESGATVNFGSVAGISQNLTGLGTVSFNSTSHGAAIDLGTDFKGTVNISGDVGLTNHKFGSDEAKVSVTGTTHFWSPTAGTEAITQALNLKSGSTTKVGGWGSKTTTLTLSGDLTFEDGASFVIADSSAGSGTAITVDIAGAVTNGTFTLNSGDKAGTLIISGTGTNSISTLTLSGGTTNITAGTTTIGTLTQTGGTLNISGTTATVSNGTLSGGLTFSGGDSALVISENGTGTLSGTVSGATVDSTAKITVNSGSTLTLDASSLVYALTGDDDSINGKTLNIATGDGTISTTGTLSRTNFTWNGNALSGRTEVSELSNGSVTFTGAAYNLFWKGGDEGTWNTTDATVWGKDSASGDSETFVAGDNVTFDTNGNIAVAVDSSGVSAGTMTVSAGTVTLSGGNVTANAANITAGTLVISSGSKLTTNDGITVKGTGTLKISSNSNIGGNVTVGTGGTFDLNGQSDSISESSTGFGTITLAGGKLVNNGSSVGTGARQLYTLTVTDDSEVGGTGNFGLIGSGYAGTTLNLGTSTLTKTGSNTFWLVNTAITGNGGTLEATAGTLGGRSENTITLGEGVTLKTSGTAGTSNLSISSMGASSNLTLAGTTASTVTISGAVGDGASINVSEGNAVTWTHDGAAQSTTATITIGEGASFKDNSNYKYALALSGKLSGAGTLISGVATTDGQGDGIRAVTLSGSTANFTGTWELETASDSNTSGNRRVNGILNSSDGVFGGVISFTDSSADSSKTSSTLSLAKDMKIGGLKGTLSNTIVQSSDSTARALTINTVDGASYDYAGTIASTISSLTKTGTGTQTLSGDNSAFAGDVTVTAGTLVAGSASALGTGTTTVESGAKLGLVAGTTVEVAGGITLAEGAKIVIDMTDVSETESFTLDLITGTALTYNSTTISSENVNTTLKNVIEFSNWSESSLDDWTQKLTFDDSSKKLSLSLTKIPEPSAFGLLAGVGALVFVAARRRRRAK